MQQKALENAAKLNASLAGMLLQCQKAAPQPTDDSGAAAADFVAAAKELEGFFAVRGPSAKTSLVNVSDTIIFRFIPCLTPTLLQEVAALEAELEEKNLLIEKHTKLLKQWNAKLDPDAS